MINCRDFYMNFWIGEFWKIKLLVKKEIFIYVEDCDKEKFYFVKDVKFVVLNVIENVVIVIFL